MASKMQLAIQVVEFRNVITCARPYNRSTNAFTVQSSQTISSLSQIAHYKMAQQASIQHFYIRMGYNQQNKMLIILYLNIYGFLFVLISSSAPFDLIRQDILRHWQYYSTYTSTWL